MQTIKVGDVTYDVPDELDWELGEVAEVARLRDEYGDVGATIGMVWLVMHRHDPSFTVAQAKQVKISSLEEPKDADDPLVQSSPSPNGISDSSNSGSLPEADELSGSPSTFASTS